MSPILRSITTTPENPRKDPTDTLASDLETSLVLARTAAVIGNLVNFLGLITTTPKNPKEDPTNALAGNAAVTSDSKTSIMLAGTATGTDDPVNFLELPLELSPIAHEA